MDLEASLVTIFESLADESFLFISVNRYPIPKIEVFPILDKWKDENSIMCVCADITSIHHYSSISSSSSSNSSSASPQYKSVFPM